MLLLTFEVLKTTTLPVFLTRQNVAYPFNLSDNTADVRSTTIIGLNTKITKWEYLIGFLERKIIAKVKKKLPRWPGSHWRP
jgi:hypothetical protein